MLLALDSNIFLTSLIRREKDFEKAKSLIKSISSAKYSAVASSIVFGEVISIASNNTELKSENFINKIQNLKTVPAGDDICIHAARLRREAGPSLKLADSIHLATAIKNKADKFISSDIKLVRIAKKYIACDLLSEFKAP